MGLLQAVQKETIKADLESIEKDELFEEMIDLLYQAKKNTDRDDVLESILNREKSRNTAITKGVALPHARTDSVKDISVVIGISKDGVNYESSFDPIHIIFLVVGPAGGTEKYISILSEIGKLLLSAATISDLKNSTSPEEILSIIEREKSRINDDWSKRNC